MYITFEHVTKLIVALAVRYVIDWDVMTGVVANLIWIRLIKIDNSLSTGQASMHFVRVISQLG